jgi:hypothetical protein
MRFLRFLGAAGVEYKEGTPDFEKTLSIQSLIFLVGYCQLS